MSKKLIWIIVAIVVIIGVLLGLKSAGIIGKQEAIKVSTEKAAVRTIIETVNASGKVYPEIEVKVSPDVAGEIIELNIEEGDSVSKGQILARIYADDYASQRDQASAIVNQQQAAVDNSKAQLESLKSAMELAQRNYDRQQQLVADKIISKAEFEQVDNALRSAKANYNAALQGIRSGQAGVQSTLASLQRANKNLIRTAVVAPMTGIVSLLNVKKGERVVGNSLMAGTEMMRIANMNIIEVRVDVGENDIPKVKMGDSALVEVDAYNNRKFKGIVTKIASSSSGSASAAASAISSNDVTNFKVHIRLLPSSYEDLLDPANPKSFPFRPGMNASADIQTNTRANVLTVPINAVTTREIGSDKPSAANKEKQDDAPESENTALDADLEEVVFIIQKDGSVKKQKVKSDIQDITYIQISEGLKAGDEVVVAPYSIINKTLKDGQKVQVVAKDKLFEVKKK
jgi:HlyD family secretion protein